MGDGSLLLTPLREVPPHREKSAPKPQDRGTSKKQSPVPLSLKEGFCHYMLQAIETEAGLNPQSHSTS